MSRKREDHRVNARLTIIALILAAAVFLTLLARAVPAAAELDKPAGAAVQTIPEASEAPESDYAAAVIGYLGALEGGELQ